MEKEGRKNECATYAGDSPDFSAEVEREPQCSGDFGRFYPILHPEEGRMLLFRSAPEITNGLELPVDATLFGTGSRHQRGRSATATIRLSSSPLSSPSVFFLSPEVRIWG